MKRSLILAAAFSVGLSGAAMAFHCPVDMGKIDTALAAGPDISAAELAEVTSLRAEGEAMHSAGKHQEAVDALGKALKILEGG
jgi:hypothetical protein